MEKEWIGASLLRVRQQTLSLSVSTALVVGTFDYSTNWFTTIRLNGSAFSSVHALSCTPYNNPVALNVDGKCNP